MVLHSGSANMNFCIDNAFVPDGLQLARAP
jgi:hypothetical protein